MKQAVNYSDGLRPEGAYLAGEEQLAGYNVLEAANLDDALAMVFRHPLAGAGLPIEVRSFLEWSPEDLG